MNYGSLFTGIGGFDLGFEQSSKFQCSWQVEISSYFRRVLGKHWPNVRRHDDATTFPPPNSSEWAAVDCIVGGDPCQENSNATRSAIAHSLGGEFVRIIDVLTPPLIVRENPAIVRKGAPWPWQRFAGELVRRGYRVRPVRVRACCVGADFRRERMFLLAKIPGAVCQGLEGNVREIMARANERRQDTDTPRPDRWSATPRVCRGVDGVPNRMDRIKCCGNTIVPQIIEWIGRRIIEAEKLRCL